MSTLRDTMPHVHWNPPDDEPSDASVSDDDRAWWAALDAEAEALGGDAPDLFDPEPLGPPAEVLAAEASYSETRDTAAGRWIAGELRTLAALALRLEAQTWEALTSGRESEQRRCEYGIWDDGYHAGERAALRA